MNSAANGRTDPAGEPSPAGGFRLETDRLVLRRWQESDYPAFADLCSDPAVMRFIPPGVLDPAVSMARAALYDGDFEQNVMNGHHYGLAAVERKSDGVFLGFTGIHHHRWFPTELEIGWRFARFAWGSGYATEAAQAVADYAFDVLDVPHLISVTMPENTRSLAVMRRLGMALRSEMVIEDVPVVVYSTGRRSGPA